MMLVKNTSKYVINNSIKKYTVRHIETATHSIKTYEQIKQKRQEALLGGGIQKIQKQHQKVR